MARILLPTDYSTNAMHAADQAVALFGAEGNTFILLHAVDHENISLPGHATDQLADARWDLSAFAERLTQRIKATDVEQQVVRGPLAHVLAGVVEKTRAQIVVMGKRGATGSVLFGSNTTDVIKHSTVPVLVVPEHVKVPSPKRILLADDRNGVQPASMAVLRLVALITRGEIMIVHVKENNPDFAGEWSHAAYAEAFEGIPYSFHYAHNTDVEEGLIRFAEEHQVGMIAVLHRQVSLLGRLFKPSHAKQLALDGDLPLLVLKV